MVTLRPRDSRIAAREAAAIPLPREDTTPPVTNTNLVITDECRTARAGNSNYTPIRPLFHLLFGPHGDFRRRVNSRAASSGSFHAWPSQPAQATPSETGDHQESGENATPPNAWWLAARPVGTPPNRCRRQNRSALDIDVLSMHPDGEEWYDRRRSRFRA